MTKLTKKQVNRIAAAAFAAVMATSMTIPAFASGNVLASEAPNGVYSSTAGSSSLYSDYQNNQVGSSEGSTSFRIPETGSNFQSSGESYVTTFDKFGESSDPSENVGQDSYVSVIPPETSTGAVDYYDGYDYDADYSTGDVTTEDAGDMTAENSVTTPAEASAEIVGEWFGVLGSSPVNLTLSGDYTYNLNLLDIGETTSGTYTTNGNQVALQLNDGIVMTLEVAADAKTKILYLKLTESAISCILWSNKPGNSESVTLHKYSISDNEVKDNGSCTHIKAYDSFSEKYFDCNIREDDDECGVFCEADGTETSGRKCTGKSYYNKEIIAYMRTTAMAINAQQRYLTRQKIFNAAGFYLRRNTYMVKLPMFVAKLLPQDSWDEKDVYFTTSDGGDAYTKDSDFLKSCLLYTVLSNQNKCLSFLGSDGRMYQNELCLDNSRYEKAKEEVTQDGKESDSEDEMQKLLPVAYQDMTA